MTPSIIYINFDIRKMILLKPEFIRNRMINYHYFHYFSYILTPAFQIFAQMDHIWYIIIFKGMYTTLMV